MDCVRLYPLPTGRPTAYVKCLDQRSTQHSFQTEMPSDTWLRLFTLNRLSNPAHGKNDAKSRRFSRSRKWQVQQRLAGHQDGHLSGQRLRQFRPGEPTRRFLTALRWGDSTIYSLACRQPLSAEFNVCAQSTVLPGNGHSPVVFWVKIVSESAGGALLSPADAETTKSEEEDLFR